MTKDERRTRMVQNERAGPGLRSVLLLAPCLCFLTGCVSASSWNWPWKKDDTVAKKPAEPRDSFVMRGLGLEREKITDASTAADLDEAKRLMQTKEHRKAEAIYHKLANAKKAPVNVVDEALFYEAECQWAQKNFRTAEGTFRKYVREFRTNGQYVEQANRRLFDIANYWLDDTRGQMAAWEEKREGKRWFVMPSSYFHWGSDKPFADMEGHALQVLEEVGLNDIRGSIRTVDGGPSIGERAMFFLATVKFFREDYHEADYYYTQLYENHPNSSLAPKAIKQSIICKQVMNGGTAYDTRTIEESRKLIDRYQGAYPEWTKDRDWLTRQLGGIHLQQADRDYKIAEFYRRTGHPGSAYFYYELVRRRYPNTAFAKKADEQMAELRGVAQRDTNVASASAGPVTTQSPNAFSPAVAAPSTGSQESVAPPPARITVTAPPLSPPMPPMGAQPQPVPPEPMPQSGPPPPLPIGPSSTPRLLPPNLGPGGN